MKRKVSDGKTMYAVFNSRVGLKTMRYVQPCKVLEVTKVGFIAECHNGGEFGNRKGVEFFSNVMIGNGVYFSKDSAEKCLNKSNII